MINNLCKICYFRDVSTLLIPIMNFNNHAIPLQKKHWKLSSLSQISLGVCVPRPLALILGSQNMARTNLWVKHITYSRLKHSTYSQYSKSYLERPSYGVQNKWKWKCFFHHSTFFSSVTKETGENFTVKYIRQVHNFKVVLKYKNMFLHYKPQTCSIWSESSSP